MYHTNYIFHEGAKNTLFMVNLDLSSVWQDRFLSSLPDRMTINSISDSDKPGYKPPSPILIP